MRVDFVSLRMCIRLFFLCIIYSVRGLAWLVNTSRMQALRDFSLASIRDNSVQAQGLLDSKCKKFTLQPRLYIFRKLTFATFETTPFEMYLFTYLLKWYRYNCFKFRNELGAIYCTPTEPCTDASYQKLDSYLDIWSIKLFQHSASKIFDLNTFQFIIYMVCMALTSTTFSNSRLIEQFIQHLDLVEARLDWLMAMNELIKRL